MSSIKPHVTLVYPHRSSRLESYVFTYDSRFFFTCFYRSLFSSEVKVPVHF